MSSEQSSAVWARLCHFNDAYTANSRSGPEPVGGAARFKTLLDAQCPAINTCGGDVFNPSLMSTLTKGRHVPSLLLALGVHVSCVGNHDLDFGVDILEGLIAQTMIPWVLSNVKIKGKTVPGCVESVVITAPQGARIA